MRIPNAQAAVRSVGVRRIADYIDLTKPRIMLLVLLTVLGGMHLAGRGSDVSHKLILFSLAGVALAVGAGGALNCFLERGLDGRMERTRRRPLPSGRIKPYEALVIGTVFWIASYFVLFHWVNPITAFLTMLAFGIYVGVYTPLKTRTPVCTLVGAVSGAMPPLIGWTAVRGHIELPGLILFAILFLWQMPHFLALALLRKSEYENAGMPMTPVASGERTTLIHMFIYTVLLSVFAVLPFHVFQTGRGYLVLSAGLSAVFTAMAAEGLVRGAGPRWCRRFFMYSIVYLTTLFSALVVLS